MSSFRRRLMMAQSKNTTVSDESCSNLIAYAYNNNNIYVSNDGGNTWRIAIVADRAIEDVTISYSGKNMIAITLEKAYISNDYGFSWNIFTPESDYGTSLYYALISGDGNVAFLFESSYIFRSYNSGKDWEKIAYSERGIGDGYYGLVCTGATDAYGSGLILSADSYNFLGVFLSTDGGDTFEKIYEDTDGFCNLCMDSYGYSCLSDTNKTVFFDYTGSEISTNTEITSVDRSPIDYSNDGTILLTNSLDKKLNIYNSFDDLLQKKDVGLTSTSDVYCSVSLFGEYQITGSKLDGTLLSNDYGNSFKKLNTPVIFKKCVMNKGINY